MSYRISTTLVRFGVAAAMLSSMLLGPALGCTAPEGSAADDGASSEDEALSAGSGTRHGEATFYSKYDDGGHCSFGVTGLTYFAAMNHTDYARSAACGACAEITGPDGMVKVRVTNECPECAPGDIDLSEQAFALLAPMSRGRIPISWQYVTCDEITGPIVYRFKEGSNPGWAGLQIRNHVRPIATVEVQRDGRFQSLRREPYNFFIADQGLGPGPYTLRVTDDAGNVIQDSGVQLRPLEDMPSPGGHQFPRGSQPAPQEPTPQQPSPQEPAPQEPQPSGESDAAGFTFQVPSTINAWWIQVKVGAPPGQQVARVDAEVNGATVPLTLQSWGDWAASPPRPVPGGTRVVFKAQDGANRVGTFTSQPWPGN